jgi:hypothetical protein
MAERFVEVAAASCRCGSPNLYVADYEVTDSSECTCKNQYEDVTFAVPVARILRALRIDEDAAYRRGIEDAARVVADQSSAILNALADIVCMTQPEGAKVKWRSELIDREMVVTEVLKIRSAHDETRKKLRALADAPAGGGE